MPAVAATPGANENHEAHTMPAEMTPEVLAFWRELYAPFDERLLSEKPGGGGKKLTWIDKRALSNRLDTVCGPAGWKVEYEATQRGYKARLSLYAPQPDGSWGWTPKEDGAGFEEMSDVDNDEKSGYTNAFRRAAQDAWGIGRYLYRKGIPDFLDPDARPPQTAGPVVADPPPPTRQQAPPKQAAAPAPQAQAGGPKKFDDFQIPKAGNGVFAWSKRMEEHYKVTLQPHMKSDAVDRGWDGLFGKWDQEQVDIICRGAIAHIKTQSNYKGEFDHVDTGRLVAVQAESAPQSAPPPPATDMQKKEVVNAIKALFKAMHGGAEPDVGQIKGVLAAISPLAANGHGNTGEVLESLKDCTDGAWIGNILGRVIEQVEAARQAGPEAAGDDIPF